METLAREGWRTSLDCGGEVSWRREEGGAGEGDLMGEEEEEGVHDHLLAAEEGVADEFAGAEGDGLVFVGHGGGLGVLVSCWVAVRSRGCETDNCF